MAEELERIFTIPLKKKNFKSTKAAPVAVRRVKEYLKRHMKVEEKDIWIDDSLNNELWSHGKYSMPGKIRVKAVKFDDGIVETYLPELEFKKSRREILREEKESKTPILKKEEVSEEEEVGGAEDYDIAPTADGDVKIKKKKHKEKKEDKEPKKKPKKKEKEQKNKPEKEKPKKKEDKSKKTPKKKTTTKKKTTAKKKTSTKKETKKKETTKQKKPKTEKKSK